MDNETEDSYLIFSWVITMLASAFVVFTTFGSSTSNLEAKAKTSLIKSAITSGLEQIPEPNSIYRISGKEKYNYQP